MDLNIGINFKDNKSIYNIRFIACLIIGKNCEFINCEFKNGCLFKESWKFTSCEFNQYCRFVRGGEFKQCKFYDILFSNFII